MKRPRAAAEREVHAALLRGRSVLRRENGAARIQATFRGRKCRRETVDTRHKLVAERERLQRQRGASLLQSMARGLLGRRP